MDLSQKEWSEKITEDKNAVILDVRTKEENEEKKIPNSINIDLYKGQGFLDEIEKLDRTKNYYIYCKSGGRSNQACLLMGQMGFDNAFNLLGGITEWTGPTE